MGHGTSPLLDTDLHAASGEQRIFESELIFKQRRALMLCAEQQGLH